MRSPSDRAPLPRRSPRQSATPAGLAAGPSIGESRRMDRTAEWDDLRAKYLAPSDERPEAAARGAHPLALLSRDVERTIGFYQGLLEFPLTELFENRDYPGSTHFFF